MHQSRLCAVLIDCRTADLEDAARFWGEALGRPVDPNHAGSRGRVLSLDREHDALQRSAHAIGRRGADRRRVVLDRSGDRQSGRLQRGHMARIGIDQQRIRAGARERRPDRAADGARAPDHQVFHPALAILSKMLI